MLVVSRQRPLPGHPPIAPFMSALEAFEIAEPARVDERGYLESVRLVSSLAGSTAHVLAAARGQTLALASPDELHVADRDLALQVALTGEFTPQWLSVDEDLRFHVVVRTAAGRMLWVVTTRGERVVHAPLPADFEPIAPPIVGYDHVVYLVAAGRIIAFTPAGGILWDRPVDAPVVTVDRKLLITTGAALDAADAQGQRERLFTAEGDVLVTPAAATPDGDLVVAGRQFLYRLRR